MVTREVTSKCKNKHKQQHGNPHDARVQVLPARSWSIITTSNAATILHTGTVGHAMGCSIRQGNIYCLYIVLYIISVITTSNAGPSCILAKCVQHIACCFALQCSFALGLEWSRYFLPLVHNLSERWRRPLAYRKLGLSRLVWLWSPSWCFTMSFFTMTNVA